MQTMITPEYPLFWLFDPSSEFGTDPTRMRKRSLMTLQEKVFNSRKTIARNGWSPRRFNPALAYIIEEIGDHFIISNESNPDLIAVSMHQKTETRHELRLFLGEV
ncbi:MAG: hypothetical protein R3C54_08795 [Parvularculaceae bacterium]